ncbi:hypothetical protein [Methylococcus geothermalis]|uniref:Uncharacterized protein n=1 Tax=Methylococcus geothermalis TaxID=2681310 RepID=A0A858Q8L7_9GAMM|nr:hypothetical protein [Methylococcus geothermalis]QJD30046.1 hypothetical protein GNH96_08730 [Methylococcus geothermalis]
MNEKTETQTGMKKSTGLPAVLAMALFAGTGVAAQDAPSLREQIEKQKAENEALKAKIARIEQVLKTDVCSNPEAAKLLESGEAADSSPQKEPEAPK